MPRLWGVGGRIVRHEWTYTSSAGKPSHEEPEDLCAIQLQVNNIFLLSDGCYILGSLRSENWIHRSLERAAFCEGAMMTQRMQFLMMRFKCMTSQLTPGVCKNVEDMFQSHVVHCSSKQILKQFRLCMWRIIIWQNHNLWWRDWSKVWREQGCRNIKGWGMYFSWR